MVDEEAISAVGYYSTDLLEEQKTWQSGEKQNIEHTGKDGETLKVELTGDIATWAK